MAVLFFGNLPGFRYSSQCLRDIRSTLSKRPRIDEVTFNRIKALGILKSFRGGVKVNEKKKKALEWEKKQLLLEASSVSTDSRLAVIDKQLKKMAKSRSTYFLDVNNRNEDNKTLNVNEVKFYLMIVTILRCNNKCDVICQWVEDKRNTHMCHQWNMVEGNGG